MIRRSFVPLWAARDVLRRPGEGLLVGMALATLIWMAGTGTLLTEAVRRTAERLVDHGPSLVIRRVGPAGFAPMPIAATATVSAVPGALRVRPRVWGPARVGDRAIEVVALTATAARALVDDRLIPDVPLRGMAIVGPGFAPERGAIKTVVGAGAAVDVELQYSLPPGAGLVAQDTFLVHPDDARRILGFAPSLATDLAVDVFRESEEAAIRGDIAAALPFDVAITTRAQAQRRYAGSLTRRGGLFVLLLVPAALAVGALVAGAARDRMSRAKEIGLLKAVGWTTHDIVWMHGFRALWVALPATGLGWIAAWLTVFAPGVTWPGTLLFGWSGPPPVLDLDPAGAGVVLVEVTAVAVVPWVAAQLWPAIASGARDPWQMLAEDAS